MAKTAKPTTANKINATANHAPVPVVATAAASRTETIASYTVVSCGTSTPTTAIPRNYGSPSKRKSADAIAPCWP
jgi:hypothetical protein